MILFCLVHADGLGREEVVCEQPLLTVDRQMGLNIVHPEGKVGPLPVDENWVADYAHSIARKDNI